MAVCKRRRSEPLSWKRLLGSTAPRRSSRALPFGTQHALAKGEYERGSGGCVPEQEAHNDIGGCVHFKGLFSNTEAFLYPAGLAKVASDSAHMSCRCRPFGGGRERLPFFGHGSGAGPSRACTSRPAPSGVTPVLNQSLREGNRAEERAAVDDSSGTTATASMVTIGAVSSGKRSARMYPFVEQIIGRDV